MTHIYQAFQNLKKRSQSNWDAYDRLNDSSFRQSIIGSGDTQLIVDYFRTMGDPEAIVENFGPESLEYTLLQSYIPKSTKPHPQSPKTSFHPQEVVTPQNVVVRGMTEDPAVDYGMLKKWLTDFHHDNKLTLPPGFHSQRKAGLTDLYQGIREQYQIPLSDIVRSLRNPFV